jgi:UDP-N-acetylglucosamine 2-epimerase
MPAEINRLLRDQLADVWFTPSADADNNFQAEGIDASRIRWWET